MAHFARIRSVGMWTVSSTVLSAEFETFDANLYKAVNGDDGGTWAPSTAITLGGQGLTISSAPLVLSSADVTWTNGTLVLSGPDVHGSADLDGTLRLNSADGVPKLFTLDNYVTVAFQDGSDVTKASLNGSTFSIGLPVTITSGGSLAIASGATMTYQGTTKPTLASRSITRIQNTTPQSSSVDWKESAGKWITDGGMLGAGELWIPLRIPHGATLTGIAGTFKPGTGHSGGLPGTVPTLRVVKLVSGTYSNVSAAVSDTSTGATYETVHSITVSGLSESVNRSTTRYFAVFVNEGGSPSYAGLEYYSTSVIYNAVSIDED